MQFREERHESLPCHGRDGVNRIADPLHALPDSRTGVEIDLGDDHGRGNPVRFGKNQEAVQQLWKGLGIGRGGENEELVEIGGDGPAPPLVRRPASQFVTARSHGGDAHQVPTLAPVERHPIAGDGLIVTAFGLSPERREDLPRRREHPESSSRATEDQPLISRDGHHPSGRAAIASSSAAFTS